MSRLIILGSANAIPSSNRENTYFYLENGMESTLIDCGANAFIKLQQSQVDINCISNIIITHFHPDHVAGLPLMLMDWWLLKRNAPLIIHGLDTTIDRIQKMMDLFDWKKWPNFFPVDFRVLPNEYYQVLDNGENKIYSMPVKHLIPTIGLRMEFEETRRVIAYSCDTEPCPGVIRLAQQADILIHEAAGKATGHSSAAECGLDARQAEARSLCLIHFPDHAAESDLLEQAKTEFAGKVFLAEDGMVFG